MVEEAMMRLSKYLALREDERTATIGILLSEIEALEENYAKLFVAYQKLLKGDVLEKKNVDVGFQPAGRK